MTGGKVTGIEVKSNEGGVTKYVGGWRICIIPAGAYVLLMLLCFYRLHFRHHSYYMTHTSYMSRNTKVTSEEASGVHSSLYSVEIVLRV
jgi:hypothetical protein